MGQSTTTIPSDEKKINYSKTPVLFIKSLHAILVHALVITVSVLPVLLKFLIGSFYDLGSQPKSLV